MLVYFNEEILFSYRSFDSLSKKCEVTFYIIYLRPRTEVNNVHRAQPNASFLISNCKWRFSDVKNGDHITVYIYTYYTTYMVSELPEEAEKTEISDLRRQKL
jgi:hypothetical protein